MKSEEIKGTQVNDDESGKKTEHYERSQRLAFYKFLKEMGYVKKRKFFCKQ